jgi:hypothetical protein
MMNTRSTLIVAAGSNLPLASPQTANRFLALNPAQLALGYKPSLASHSAQDSTLSDLLAKPLEHLIL